MRPEEIVGERFLIDRLAKSGGMGRIYQAKDLKTGDWVALKVLLGSDAEGMERFRHEAQILSELGHPAIVRYIDHGTTPFGQAYIAMEWIDGEDLAARLSREGLTLGDSVALALHTAEALAVAHARGIVHRDIKPSNLMLAGGAIDRVKVLDFGIARMSSMTRAVTQTGTVMGTPGYLAPEYARGERDLSPRADVFSLGTVLFECLTGQRAFDGDQVVTVLAKLLLQEVPRLSEFRSDVPAALDELVARMLAKQPGDRPEDGAAVAKELRALAVSDTPGVAVRPVARKALTESEQRMVCVIVATPFFDDLAGPQDDRTLEVGLPDALKKRLRSALSPLGAHVDALADRTVLAALVGAESATDQAARAARCALVMRALLPDAPIALVTGRGEATGKLSIGQVVEQAVKVLQSAPEPSARGTQEQTPPSGDELVTEALAPATPMPIQIDDVTRALLDLRFDVAMGSGGYELRAEREISEGVRTLLGQPTPCVGREREQQAMCALFDECVGDRVAHAMLVTGPAGIGKSRLREEFIRKVRQSSPQTEVWTGRGDAMNAGSAFAVIGSALRHAAEVFEGEPLTLRQKKLLTRVGRHVKERHRPRIAEFLAEVIGAPFGDDASPKLRAARQSVHIMADQIRAAWADFLAAECEAHPVLLVLEDLHWGDLPSVKLVQFVLAHLREAPLLILGIARPEVHDMFPRLWMERGVQQIHLSELPRRAASGLVRYALGSAIDTDKITEMVDRAAGNAFYLEELIRTVADGRGDALPETVLGMVESRLSALDPDARRLLRAASIFGDVFWKDGVIALLGGVMESKASDHLLQVLGDKEVIVRRPQSRFVGEQEYAFRQALLRESSYAMLTPADRKLGHRLAAEWLEHAGESDPMLLAEHFERGGEPARAVSRYLRAAEQALQGDDPKTALARVDRAIQCGARGESRALLLNVRGEALASIGDFAGAEAATDEVFRTTRPGTRAWCAAVTGKLVLARLLNKRDILTGAVQGLLEVVPTPDAVGQFACLLGMVVTGLNMMQEVALADAYIRRLEAVVEPVVNREPAARGWLATARANRERLVESDPWNALKLGQMAEAGFEEAGARRWVAMAQLGIALDLILLGAHVQAIDILRNVVKTAGDGAGILTSIGKARLIRALAEAGALPEALSEATSLLDFSLQSGNRHTEGLARLWLGIILLQSGDFDAAEREATFAMDRLIAPLDGAWATATLADIRRRQGRVSDALSLVEQAVARCGGLRAVHIMQTAIAPIYVEVLDAAGDREGALAALSEARRDVIAAAGKINEPAYRKSFLENVPANARTLALAVQYLGPVAEAGS